MKFQSLSLRFKILLPVSLVLTLFCFGGFLSTHFIQRDHLDEMIENRIKSTGQLFKTMLDIDADSLQGIAEAYSENKSLQEAFLSGDRDRLFLTIKSNFNEIHAKYDITHFYFHTPDNRCFLRVHNPSRHSDLIERHTIKQASLKSAPSRGYELGPLGTLTLRVVVPWFINGKMVGFIELGKEIDHILPRLKQVQGVDLIFAVEKKHLDRQLWEEGLKVMNKSGNWNHYLKHVINSSTFEELPDELESILVYHYNTHSKELLDLVCDDCRFRVGAIPLIDAGGTEIGDAFVFRNLDDLLLSQKAFQFFVIISIVVLIALYFLFAIYFGNIDKSVNDYQSKLEKEIKNHESTEKKLAEHQKKLDQMVKRKTSELEEAIAEVKILSGFLPICASCKSIRTDKGEWEQIESYIRDHSEAEFSHSYCPKCAQKLYSDFKKS